MLCWLARRQEVRHISDGIARDLETQFANRKTALAKLRLLTDAVDGQRQFSGSGRRHAGKESAADLNDMARDLVSARDRAFTTLALAISTRINLLSRSGRPYNAIDALETAAESITPISMRSRGPSPARIDQEWPSQVALPDDLCTGHSLTLIREFCKKRRLSQ
ncbi:hypothetical protein [Mesorhizobium sp.]|uniref:hypothetical protein n=1 Tax=Mesorhizobium sp. TaxID=1871066 RepID=UPI0011F6A647|nr:hypothetical protein [Mesorhizobium sp.]TIP09242.1 MAG: hypothetical protein E5X73_28520 [Mesorhizobium sp.]